MPKPGPDPSVRSKAFRQLVLAISPGGTCYALRNNLPGVPDYTAYIGITDPTVAVTGTVLFVTGGDGTDLVEDRMYGPVVVQTILQAGYRPVELSYGDPFNSNE